MDLPIALIGNGLSFLNHIKQFYFHHRAFSVNSVVFKPLSLVQIEIPSSLGGIKAFDNCQSFT
jgi:hypothetical protein